MIIYQISKKLCLSLVLTVLTIFYAYADVPIISERYPLKVNLNQPATLLLIGQNLSSPLTVTMGAEVIPITDNTNSNRVSCAISSRSTLGEMELTVQNSDGISEKKMLLFSDCSQMAQVDNIIRTKDYTITVVNTCYPDYQYQLDTNVPININASQILLKGLAEGSHQLTITGSDPAGNKMSEFFLFSVDSIEPEVQFVNKPGIITTNDSETISITSSTDATHYMYKLDNTNFIENAISEAIVLTSLSFGMHTITIYGCDSMNYCQSASANAPITWTVIDISFASDSALTTTTVLAGTQSGIYSTNCTQKDVLLEWTVYDSENNKVGNTIIGETFSFTPSKNGAYAGVYTLNMSAKHDNQTIKTLNAYIGVPFDIESNCYNLIDETIFRVKGVASGATLIPGIKPNANTTLSISDIGKWDRTNAEDMQITFMPSETLDKVSSFDVWISVENDDNLNEKNGLFERITGPFFVIPLKDYAVSLLSDENEIISTTSNNDITIKELVRQNTQNLEASESEVRFHLPASGGTYFFKVIDNRTPPEYLSESFYTTSLESIITLHPVGEYVIEGSVMDSGNNYLENVTVTAFQPVDNNTQSLNILPQKYQAKTESSGKYTIYLPELNEISGWTVIAGKEGYISSIQTDQQANKQVSFDGIHALQLQTQITKIWIENDEIHIQANPAFKEPREIDVRKITPKSDNYYDENQFHNDKSISVARPTSDEYTLIIYADTTDNHDPRTGTFVSHAYRKNSTEYVLARNDKTMDKFGGTVSLDNNNQVAEVEIPVNGITETATITIEQIEKSFECNATTGSQYIYAVHATSVNSGHSLTDDQINEVAVTIPFNLRTIYPGDIENSVFNVYRADSLEKLENHQTELISNIRQSDYLGNGKIGTVTVLVDKISYFAIGIPNIVAVRKTVKDDGGGDCFIGILH